MGLDRLPREAQSEAGAGDRAFGGAAAADKGLEDTLLFSGRNAGASVDDRDRYPLLIRVAELEWGRASFGRPPVLVPARR